MRRAAFALFLLIAGCTSLMEPAAARWSVSIAKSFAHPRGPAPPISHQLSGDTLRVSGFFSTATPCNAVTAAVSETASRVTVHLLVTPSSSGCVFIMARYDFEIEGLLRSGEHQLLVLLSAGDRDGATTVLLDTYVDVH